MAAKKSQDARKGEKEDREETAESPRHAGVENTAGPGYTQRSAQAENEKLHRDPPPLAHVDPTTGKVLSEPLEKSHEANRNTVPGDGGVKDARPNNGNPFPNGGAKTR